MSKRSWLIRLKKRKRKFETRELRHENFNQFNRRGHPPAGQRWSSEPHLYKSDSTSSPLSTGAQFDGARLFAGFEGCGNGRLAIEWWRLFDFKCKRQRT